MINWQCFGSNGHEKADYSRGVLERFTRRAPYDLVGNLHVKTIANPRVIINIINPHYAKYFEGKYALNSNGNKQAVVLEHSISYAFNKPVAYDKIVINHYLTKSREEYRVKRERGRADAKDVGSSYTDQQFKKIDHNDEFDDGILFYRDARAEIYQPPDKSHTDERLLSALERNLSPTLKIDTPLNFYAGKMETFLTCRAVANYLKTKLTDDTQVKLFEEASLKAILKALENSPSVADKELFDRELPELLKLPYPVVEELRKV